MPSTRQLIQSGAFALLYRFGRWVYDPLTELLFDGEWDRWRRSVLDSIEAGPVLDIGCGTGALMEAMIERGWQVVGLDRSPGMLKAASTRGLRYAPLVQAESGMMPFMDGVFRTCVTAFPAEFIRQPQTLNEIYRILEVGGTFAMVLGGRLDLDSRRRRAVSVPLRIFYGRSTAAAPPIEWAPLHPGLPGLWKSVPTVRGTAFIWLARKLMENDTNQSNADDVARTRCQPW